MKTEELHRIFLKSKGVSIDSREDLDNKVFFALKGDNFDGNKFAEKTIDKGAICAVVDDLKLKEKSNCIWVEDVLMQLQELAKFHRQYLGLKILAITGSNGKTTTKELVASVLTKKFKVDFTKGNLNNHIGVPLTLLKMTRSTEFGVVEMGANHQREIEFLCEIAQPDFGYITNFGKAHLEGFGGFEGVIKGKSELYQYLKLNDKQIFYNEDDPIQTEQSLGGNRIGFGEKDNSNCQIRFLKADPYVSVGWEDIQINSQLIGDYNYKNMSFAICAGTYFGVSQKDIKNAIEAYKPDNNRSQIIEKNSNIIILDAYNANPTSMLLALKSFVRYPSENKMVVLGDMFEVGSSEIEEHQRIVDFLEESGWSDIYVCGEIFFKTKTNKVCKFKSFEELQNELTKVSIKNTAILIKGSRGMAMERMLELL